VLHHRRWLYRYDTEGSQTLGLITVQRNRFTRKFKTASYQHKYMRKATRLSLGEYLAVSKIDTAARAVHFLSKARGCSWHGLPDSEPSPDANPDHSFAWFIASVVAILAAWGGVAYVFSWAITKVAS
jgi:hypothetical protein